LICNWYGQGMTATNVSIYGNTFYNLEPEAVIGFDGSTNVNVKNNVFYGASGISWYGTITHDYNWCYPSGVCSAVSSELHGQIASGNPFTNAVNGDFSLATPTNAGATLSLPYGIDIVGKTRGSDGIWDRGAYEYDEAGRPLPPLNMRVK
jgi:hypothetical protein